MCTTRQLYKASVGCDPGESAETFHFMAGDVAMILEIVDEQCFDFFVRAAGGVVFDSYAFKLRFPIDIADELFLGAKIDIIYFQTIGVDSLFVVGTWPTDAYRERT